VAKSTPQEQLFDRLGLVFDAQLLELALTHRSFAYESGGLPTNERLEFLGDSVLGVVVTDELYHRYPDLPEGNLAKLRSAVVSARALAVQARRLGLGEFIRLGRGEETTGGRDKSSILADTFEALALVWIGKLHFRNSLPSLESVFQHMQSMNQDLITPSDLKPKLFWPISITVMALAATKKKQSNRLPQVLTLS